MVSRLKNFSIRGLFGEFSYEIPIRHDERITVILGPNGVGKTVCLRLINALFRRQPWAIADTLFDVCGFGFTGGEHITITRSAPDNASPNRSGDEDIPAAHLCYRLELPDGRDFDWEPRAAELARGNASRIVRVLPFLTRLSPAEWIHDHTRERYTLERIAEDYSDRFPEDFFTSSNDPEPFKALTSTIDCHLIETQRLLVLEPAIERGPYEFYSDDIVVGRRPRNRSNLVVLQKAQRLRDILQNKLRDYGILSQSLDRSFPRRVIASQAPSGMSESALKEQFDKLDKQRSALTAAGILDAEFGPVSIEAENIQGVVARVLEIYLRDTTQKLDVFADLLAKISLFKALIDDRFIGKKISIDRRSGFSFSAKSGREIPLEKLSSGEQHQLILVFELLFELRENALILIDEPELSLHVSWQKKFISDLQRIISLNNFDVILATHSPQLIGRWSELTTELGDVEEDAVQN